MRLVEKPKPTEDCCPPAATLMQFLEGRLPESRIQIVEEHVTCCHSCGDTIRKLDNQSTRDDLAKMIAAGDSSLKELEAEQRQPVDLLIDRLQGLNQQDGAAKQQPSGETSPGQDSETRAKEVTHLLGESDQPNHLGRVAHFEVTHLLGTGGTGVVYKAIDTQLQRPVALKILRPSVGVAARKRFLSEARSAARIDHEQVITIYNVGEEDELAYIAMQWLPGETLESRLQRERTLGNDQAADIFRQVALGLAAAHDQGLIHRDIKPANIWIEQDGGRVKILDFGLARVADDDPQFTETGMIAGTPTFMSPEQARGGQVDGRSDLFSLGCVLYRMIAGQLPFQAANVLATLQSIQRYTPAAPQELNPGTSQHLNDLALSLLEKNADLRPQSAVAVLHALETDKEKWDFKVPESRTITDDKPKPQKTLQAVASKQKPHLVPERGIGRWVVAGLMLALISGACWMFGPQIIRIANGKAMVTIETNDDDVQIEVLQDGKVVKLLDNQTNQSIVIKEGTYQLQAMGEGNSVSISPAQLVLNRGDKQIVSVKIEPASSGGPRSAILNKTGSTIDEVMIAKAIDEFIDAGSGSQDIAKFYEQTRANVERQILPEFTMHAIKAVMLSEEIDSANIKADYSAYAVALKRKLTESVSQATSGYYKAIKDPKWAPHMSPKSFADILQFLHRLEMNGGERSDRKFVPDATAETIVQPSTLSNSFGQPNKLNPIAAGTAYGIPDLTIVQLVEARNFYEQSIRKYNQKKYSSNNSLVQTSIQALEATNKALLDKLLNTNASNSANNRFNQPSQLEQPNNQFNVNPSGVSRLRPTDQSAEVPSNPVRQFEPTNKAVDVQPHAGERSASQSNSWSELKYEGEKLRYWIEQAKTERSTKKCSEIASAMVALGEKPQSKEILDALFNIYKHTDIRSISIGNIGQMFQRLDPDVVAEKFTRELAEGNELSRYAVSRLMGSIYGDRKLARAFTRPETLRHLLDAFESSISPEGDSMRWRDEFLLNLYWAGIGAQTKFDPFNSPPLQDNVIGFKERKRIATLLNRFRNKTESSSRTKFIQKILIFESIGEDEVAEDFMKVFWSNDREKARDRQRARERAASNLSEFIAGGGDPTAAVEYLVEKLNQKLESSKSIDELFLNQPSRQAIELFSQLKGNAKPALPFLLKLESQFREKNVMPGLAIWVRRHIKAVDKESFDKLPKLPDQFGLLNGGGGPASAGGGGASDEGAGLGDDKDSDN